MVSFGHLWTQAAATFSFYPFNREEGGLSLAPPPPSHKVNRGKGDRGGKAIWQRPPQKLLEKEEDWRRHGKRRKRGNDRFIVRKKIYGGLLDSSAKKHQQRIKWVAMTKALIHSKSHGDLHPWRDLSEISVGRHFQYESRTFLGNLLLSRANQNSSGQAERLCGRLFPTLLTVS